MGRFQNKRGMVPGGGRPELSTMPFEAGKAGGVSGKPVAATIRPMPAEVSADAGGKSPVWQKLGFDSRGAAGQAMKEAEGQGSLRDWLRGRLKEGGGGGAPVSDPLPPAGGEVAADADYGTDMVARPLPGAPPGGATIRPMPIGGEAPALGRPQIRPMPFEVSEPGGDPALGRPQIRPMPAGGGETPILGRPQTPVGDPRAELTARLGGGPVGADTLSPPGGGFRAGLDRIDGGGLGVGGMDPSGGRGFFPPGGRPSFRQIDPQMLRPYLQRIMGGGGGVNLAGGGDLGGADFRAIQAY